MKLMIASDIHGSAHYCRYLLEAFEEEQPQRLLLLGDILYHGPRNDLPREYAPKEVAAMLNEISGKVLCVRGNCDSEVDQMMLNFPILADYAYVYADGQAFFATHGHIFNEDAPPKLSAGDILLCGHTHVPKFQRHKGYTYANCGSVSIPKENTPHSYMTFENGVLSWKHLNGNVYMSKRV